MLYKRGGQLEELPRAALSEVPEERATSEQNIHFLILWLLISVNPTTAGYFSYIWVALSDHSGRAGLI